MVSNTHLPSLRRLQGWFGGNLRELKRYSRARHRRVYQWTVCGETALAVCGRIRPHLFEKGKQVDVVFKLRARPAHERKALLAKLKQLKRVET